VRHFVLTRSAYGPDWTRAANLRRLRITEAVTARLMAAQTDRAWTWIVALDPRDPLIDQRLRVFQAGNADTRPLIWQPAAATQAPWDRSKATTEVQKIAATAYRAPWSEAIGDRAELTLITRIDDDDGFAPDALERVARRAEGLTGRTILMQPIGYRTWDGRAIRVAHDENAMHTLATPAGDTLSVYDYGHREIRKLGIPIVTVDRRPAWLWVRHRDTISGHRNADGPITRELRRLFPIDWTAIA
jgi:hypothetical protein